MTSSRVFVCFCTVSACFCVVSVCFCVFLRCFVHVFLRFCVFFVCFCVFLVFSRAKWLQSDPEGPKCGVLYVFLCVFEAFLKREARVHSCGDREARWTKIEEMCIMISSSYYYAVIMR